jgi:hypothetical protein
MGMKDTYYFSHDYNVRSDDKIKRLLRTHKMTGYGIFWAIIEDLYNNANALPTDYEGIAFDMHTDNSIIKSVINDFDLFIIEDGFFGSKSVERRLDERNDKSEKARQSAFKRWIKDTPDANAMRTQCERNAIKERKEKKLKESKENIIYPFDSENFKEIWEHWKIYKKEQHSFIYKSSMSEQAALKKLGELSGQDEGMAISIISQSIANGWQGLFQIKEQKDGSRKSKNDAAFEAFARSKGWLDQA